MPAPLALLLFFQAPAPRPAVTVAVAPDHPRIEQDPSLPNGPQYLNFDLVIANGTTGARTLSAIHLTATDRAGATLWQRYCDGSGLSPCIATIPGREIAAGRSGIIYNPFHTLPGDLALEDLTYELRYADSAGTLVDTVRTTVHPERPRGLPALLLPLTGRVLVFDGHDALSHHRRWDLSHPVIRAVGFTGNSGRYAYDLSVVDGEGKMFRGEGKENRDWYSWEQPVRAPAAGTVVALANEEPDWEIGRTSLPDSVIFARPIALYGNYVVIDHGHGAFSLIAHLRQGSIPLHVGDRVTAGQQLGKVGYSGSVFTIHTHYQLQDGPRYSAEGLPSYFTGVTRVGAARRGTRGAIRIDSGDLVESR